MRSSKCPPVPYLVYVMVIHSCGSDRTGKDELLETAMALHDAAIKDEYFVKRKLAPNVDFWYVTILRRRLL